MQGVISCPVLDCTKCRMRPAAPLATYASEASATAERTRSTGQRGSSSPLSMKSGRGATQRRDNAASKAEMSSLSSSARPGTSRDQTAFTTAVSISERPRSAAAVSKRGLSESTRPPQRPSRKAPLKDCTPMAGAATATRSSAAESNQAAIPPSDTPTTPILLRSTSGRSPKTSRTSMASEVVSNTKGRSAPVRHARMRALW
mmetsp:Transcript_13488/g.29597  ORF Transcript_13488/g.29597 Transcript_13488/m.29597 type:complete len:202 (+) Transcript_13488:148-753(+)